MSKRPSLSEKKTKCRRLGQIRFQSVVGAPLTKNNVNMAKIF